MAEESILKTLKKAIELAMPDLRSYYRMTRKAKVIAAYPADGRYFADVQPLKNDGSVDENEPVIPKVELPVIWGGPDRGIVCPPEAGSLCDLSYYDGDPNYPFISNIRYGLGQNAPGADLKEFVIQLEPGVEIRIDKEKRIIALTPEDAKTETGKAWTVKAGRQAVIEAPEIILKGNITTTGGDGGKASVTETGNRTQHGNLAINGTLNVNGDINCTGTAYAASRSGAPI